MLAESLINRGIRSQAESREIVILVVEEEEEDFLLALVLISD